MSCCTSLVSLGLAANPFLDWRHSHVGTTAVYLHHSLNIIYFGNDSISKSDEQPERRSVGKIENL